MTFPEPVLDSERVAPQYRQNPETGQLAELVPEQWRDPERPWFTWWWDEHRFGLTVEVLSDEAVAGWIPVEVRAIPQSLADKVAARDFLDFPTAWAIQRAGVIHDHRCSAQGCVHGGLRGDALLCDCGAVEARWRELRAALGLLIDHPAGALDRDAADPAAGASP